jgi:tetratricopeptide (TPR) repeat protein
VLGEDPKNTKALFRRGKARAELGQTDAAKEDFEKARKLEPENKEVIRELRVIAKQERELYDKQREMYKGLFKPPTASATGSQDSSALP